MNRNSKIFVAGHDGLVGAAVVRRLQTSGFQNLLLRQRKQVDLTSQGSVRELFSEQRPEYVFLIAGKVGGIVANSTYPADFLYQNLLIQANVIDAAYRCGVRKLLTLGSSCIYPKFAPQPITEEALLAGVLEPTNEWYAVAKIAGLKMCQAYRKQYGFNAIAAMPTNVYGPGDNFDLQNSHVLPALLRRAHDAKRSGATEVVVWGSGQPRREFIHSDDLADALLFLMEKYDGERWINVGCGSDLSIAELAETICRAVGFSGSIRFDPTKPDGTPRKLLDVSRLTALGWGPRITLEAGVRSTYSWFVDNADRFA